METTKALAWHNDPALKAEVTERLRKHREQDEFVQGVYQRIDPDKAARYRGCAIGCTLPLQPKDQFGDPHPATDATWHRAVERLYGIPLEIAGLIDDVFESRQPSKAGDFAVEVIEAIEPGAGLSDIEQWASSLMLSADYNYEFPPDDTAELLIEKLRSAPVAANSI